MNIYINNFNGSENLLTFPSIPETIQIQNTASFASFNIINQGEVKIPNGEGLGSYSWSGMLFGAARLKYEIKKNKTSEKSEGYIDPIIGDHWVDPAIVIAKFEGWKKGKTELYLLINDKQDIILGSAVYLESYTFSPVGGFGDYEYTVNFVQRKNLTSEVKRFYTVKKGDNLHKIAHKKLKSGKRYVEIYKKNKKLIDGRNVKEKEKTNKYRVYPGQVLKIP